MAGSYDAQVYAWLHHEGDRPGARLVEASCFTFIKGITDDEVVRRAGLSDVEWRDLSHEDDPFNVLDQNVGAVFADGVWTVLYQDNGYPQQIATSLCSAEDVSCAVVVFWNVNAVLEFSYWENGSLVAGFSDFTSQHIGSAPDRLINDLQSFGLTDDGPEEAQFSHEQYRRMLALAEHLTGVRITPDFLSRERVALGVIDE